MEFYNITTSNVRGLKVNNYTLHFSFIIIIYNKIILEEYHHCCSGVEATQLSSGQVLINLPLDKVVGVEGTSNDHLLKKKERGTT